MHRLIVALLAAVDAAIAVAVGLAATLAPLALLWIFGFGGAADWSVLWPTGVTVWQFGNLVPLVVTLPPEYLAATGIDTAAASFTLSLAPLAFATFTAIFAARSGMRASRSDAWITGVVTASAVFAALAAGAAFTAQNTIADAELWQAILVPAAVFAVPLVAGAIVTEWREAGAGAIARLRDRVEETEHGWAHVPGLIARGTAVVVVGLIGLGAAVAAVALFVRAGQIVALFQAGNVDGVGAAVITLAQIAYLPTLVIWGLSFAAGPGFAVGAGTSVSPAGTQLGVIPGLPVLGAVPESTTTWLLLLALVPVALGALAGWIARSRMVGRREPEPDPLAPERDEPIAARLAVTAGIAVLAAAAAALLSFCASGSLGPGALSTLGPAPGQVALAVGVEVLLGASILLLAPRSARSPREAEPSAAPDPQQTSDEHVPGADETDTHAFELPEIPARLRDHAAREGWDRH